jgi:hypothetical protein
MNQSIVEQLAAPHGAGTAPDESDADAEGATPTEPTEGATPSPE